MNTYVIRRRNGWPCQEDLEVAAGKSMKVGKEEMPDKVKWIRSYVVHEEDGTLGTVCIYQGVSEDAIREHADRAGLPANEITLVAQTVIVNPDPKEAGVSA